MITLSRVLISPSGRRRRRARHAAARFLRVIGAGFYLVAGVPNFCARGLMRLGSRANGLAYRVDADK